MAGSGRLRPFQLNDSATQADRNRLGAITSAQLLHDVLDVNLDRLLRDEEFLRNVPIPVPADDELQDLPLTRSQVFLPQIFRQLGTSPV